MFLVAVSALAQLTNPTVYAPSLPFTTGKTNQVQIVEVFTNYIDSDVFGDRKRRTNFVTTVFAVDIPGHGRATNQVVRTNCVTLKLKWVEEK